MIDPTAAPALSSDAEVAKLYELYHAGHLDDARERSEAYLRAHPANADAHYVLGLIELARGAVERGMSRIEGPAAARMSTAAASQLFGRLRFEQQRFAQAERWLRTSLRLDANRAESHYWLGNTLRMLGDTAGAESAFRESIRLEPRGSRAYIALAFFYRSTNRYAEAADTVLRLVESCPVEEGIAERAVAFLEAIQRHELAERVAASLEKQKGDDSEFLTRLGRLREKIGLFAEAADSYRRALGRDPAAAAACLGLAVVRKFDRRDDPDAELIRRTLDTHGATVESNACAHFALGKIYDDCKDFDRAFEHYRQANSLRASGSPFDHESFRQQVQAIRDVFTEEAFAALPRAIPRVPTPIFVVGMLRSGTTLVESILGAHSEIHPAGELHEVGAIADSIGGDPAGSGPYPACIPRLPASAIQVAADGYHRIIDAFAGGRRFVIDKNPLNFLHLGLIAVLFPQARILHCSRHPLDVCLSIYFQNFAHRANAYAYDLEAIAEVYVEYVTLMRHWREHLPLRIFDVDYAELVVAPRLTVEQLLDFIGVAFDERCLRFDTEARTIHTASAWQARQPIYRHSIGRWQNYYSHIRPLVDRLRAAGIAGES